MAEQRAWLMEVMAPDGRPLEVRFYLLRAGKVPTFTAHAERAKRFASQAEIDEATGELMKAGEQPAQGRLIPQEHVFGEMHSTEPGEEPEEEKAPPPPPPPAPPKKPEPAHHPHPHRNDRKPGR